ncbi:hypothetical protein QBC34DRAFT_428830 [Podospora aff. communis PSN243]|uniref:Uncharacterized protein n=1 Tax=Podospora aff. communis PSN243 TaxID=3040156 RepID=A0AAV9G9Y5_9PEZI|nr:hypothetical protein QBC34DRAFT_428830 [Podospora aff. communis PSN243]
MHFSTTSLAALLALGPASTLAVDCNCKHNTDAGRWKDSQFSPSKAVEFLNKGNGGCYEGSGQGKICVYYSGSDGGEEESHHGDWFLWTNSECEFWDTASGEMAKRASGKVLVFLN